LLYVRIILIKAIKPDYGCVNGGRFFGISKKAAIGRRIIKMNDEDKNPFTILIALIAISWVLVWLVGSLSKSNLHIIWLTAMSISLIWSLIFSMTNIYSLKREQMCYDFTIGVIKEMRRYEESKKINIVNEIRINDSDKK
jgi:hypothetical protein